MSVDQFVVNTYGILPTGYGIESSSYLFHGVTIHNNVATGIIWFKNQVSLGSSETVLGKDNFEQWLC